MHPFPPLYDESSKILILGSLPSVKSREQLFFYGHPQNRFWKVMAALTGENVPMTIDEKKELLKLAGKPTVTADGRRVELLCNIGKPDDCALVIERDGEGVGLFRTEFLYMDSKEQPGEEQQFEAYKKAAMTLKGKPVTIRTLDVGGDKDIPY